MIEHGIPLQRKDRCTLTTIITITTTITITFTIITTTFTIPPGGPA